MSGFLIEALKRNKLIVGIILAVVAVGGILLVGLLGILISVGWNAGKGALSYFENAPQAITVLAKDAVQSPAIIAAVKRKIACVGLIGGPSGNWMFEQASGLASTDFEKQQVSQLGAKLGFPTDGPVPADKLFSECVGNFSELLN